jgi:hypothetical protein
MTQNTQESKLVVMMTTDPIMLTDQEIDDLVAKLSNSLGIVIDTEPLEVF